MSNFFDAAIEVVLKHEGGFSDHPSDPGGATQWGISLRFLKDYTTVDPAEFDRYDIDNDGDIDALDIRGMSRENAVHAYKEAFWDKNDYDRLEHYLVARKIFDLCVNVGSKQAHKIAQRAVRAASGTPLLEDGILGQKTATAINKADPYALLSALRSEAAGFYRVLAHVDPKLNDFLKGWLNRAYY